MDLQHAFDFILTILIAGGAWIMKVLHSRLDDHDKQFDNLPETYARRDDMRERQSELIAFLVRIEEKLDRKVDRTHG